jgi:hypothetical protein
VVSTNGCEKESCACEEGRKEAREEEISDHHRLLGSRIRQAGNRRPDVFVRNFQTALT